MLVRVIIGSEVFGDSCALCVHVDAKVIDVEMPEPMPLGAVVTVHFIGPGRPIGETAEIVARAEVKHILCLNHAAPSYGAIRRHRLKILDFDNRPPLDLPKPASLH